MKIGDFFVQLGVKSDLTSVRDFVKALGDLPLEAAGALLAIGGITYKLSELAKQALETAVGFQMFTSETGLSAQELQRWQIVAEQANVSTEAVTSSVTALERKMAEIRLTGQGVRPFMYTGISVNQNAFGVLTQLRQWIKGKNPATVTNILSEMGIDPSMIHLLSLSDKKFKEYTQTIKGMSGDQQASFLKIKESMVKLGLVIRDLSYNVFGELIFQFNLLFDLMGRFKPIFPIIIAGLALIAAAFFPITATIVGLILVLADLAAYFEGGDSLFGRVLDKISKTKFGKFDIKNPLLYGGGLPAFLFPGLGAAKDAATGATKDSVRNIINMTVNAVGDAEKIAHHVVNEIKRSIGHAELQTNNGGH